MPCRTDPYEEPYTPRLYHGLTAEELEATLCAVFTVLESIGEVSGNKLQKVVMQINWLDAGVDSRKVHNWWKSHKEADNRRRAYEEAERQKTELRNAALNKLTPEERKALGLK